MATAENSTRTRLRFSRPEFKKMEELLLKGNDDLMDEKFHQKLTDEFNCAPSRAGSRAIRPEMVRRWYSRRQRNHSTCITSSSMDIQEAIVVPDTSDMVVVTENGSKGSSDVLEGFSPYLSPPEKALEGSSTSPMPEGTLQRNKKDPRKVTVSYKQQFKSSMLKICNTLKDLKFTMKHREQLKKTPFWNLLDALKRKSFNIDKIKKFDEDIVKVLKLYNPKENAFNIGTKLISITDKDVSLIFGIEEGGEELKVSSMGRPGDSAFLNRRFPTEQKPTGPTIKEQLLKAYEGKKLEDYEDFSRLCCLYLFVTLFFSKNAQTLGWAYFSIVENLDTMRDYSWSNLILKELLSSMKKKQENPIKVTGCVLMLLFWLCEHTTLISPTTPKGFPWFVKWDLVKLHKKMIIKDLNELKPTEVKDVELAITKHEGSFFYKEIVEEDMQPECVNRHQDMEVKDGELAIVMHEGSFFYTEEVVAEYEEDEQDKESECRNNHQDKEVSEESAEEFDKSFEDEEGGGKANKTRSGTDDDSMDTSKRDKASEESEFEFEARSSRDEAWYDIATFLTHRVVSSSDVEVRVRFQGFGTGDDEWVNVKQGVRPRSIPLESSDCRKVAVGDLVLCFRDRSYQAAYFDAHVLNIERREHDIKRCRCRFMVRFDHDGIEETLRFSRLCRRPPPSEGH